MTRPAWATERLVTELALEMAEARPSARASVFRAAPRAALARAVAEPGGLRAEARLLLAAAAWNLGALRATSDATAARRQACGLLTGGRSLAREASRERRDSPSSAFAVQLEETASRHAPQLCTRPAAPQPPADAPWIWVAGQRIELYVRWAESLFAVGQTTGHTSACVQGGAAMPLIESGRLALGVVLGYGYVGDYGSLEGAAHRIELPLRLDYGALFVDAGLVAGFVRLRLDAGVEPSWRSGAGLLLRAGVRKSIFQISLAYVDLPAADRRLSAGEFAVGLGW